MRKHRTLIRTLVLSILVLAVGFTIFQTVFMNNSDKVKAEKAALDFTLPTLDGKAITLSDYKGKGVILNFWGTYCPPCVREMPRIEEKYQQYKDQGLAVIAVNVGENKVTVSGFARRLGLTIPIALDQKREKTKLYNIGPMPATVFIRPDGTVLPVTARNISTNKALFVGELSEEVLEENIKKILP